MRPPCPTSALRSALEVVGQDPRRQLLRRKLDRMPTGPALDLDVGAAGREQRVGGRVGSHAAAGIRFRRGIKPNSSSS